MNIIVTGQVKRIEIGTGTWALIADNGQTYELMEPPAELTQKKAKVTVMGEIRSDVMTLAMIGPVLQVTSFQSLPWSRKILLKNGQKLLFKLVISKNSRNYPSHIPERKIVKKTLKVDFFENNLEILDNNTTIDSNFVLGTSE